LGYGQRRIARQQIKITILAAGFNEHELDKARARYLILSPEDMENDDIIDLLERTPTFRRESKFKEKIKEMQSNSAHDNDSNRKAKPAANKPSGNVISFGEEM
jgi:hypothetical protein